MKKTATLLALFIFLNPTIIFSQEKRANHWYFGFNGGLDFTSGAPQQVTDGALNTSEGCSSISDTSGNLLFYTDGITVYNRQHGTMPNGTGLTGDISSTQSALIVPKPGNPDIYYVFTTDELGGADGFRYSLVDMTLDGGNGDVTAKNVLIQNTVAEKVCGVGNPTGTGYWVLTHDWGTNGFYAYFLSDTGFNLSPVISNVGTVHSNVNIQNTFGQMKFSPNSKKLALGIGYQDIYELFDFNNTTGAVSNAVLLSNTPGKHANGVEFSRDSKKVYTTRYDNLNDMYYLDQFDLSVADSLIAASVFPLSNDDGMRQLQLGPDGKIYVAKFNQPYLSVINYPNQSGINCNYQNNGVPLDTAFNGLNNSALGLPSFVASFFYQLPLPESAFTTGSATFCPGTCINFTDLSLNNVFEWQWRFTGATPDTSSQQNPQNICYPQSGFYSVRLITRNSVGYDTTTVNNYVEVLAAPPVSVSVSGDTFVAYNAVSYQWYKDGNLIPNATNGQYIASDVAGNYTVLVTDANGCTAMSNPIILMGVSGVAEAEALKIFPVPAYNEILFALPQNSGDALTAIVINALGETVLQSKLSSNAIARLDVSTLPKGYYQLRLNSSDAVWSSGFMKQ